jgi:hypothetical protein
MTNTYRPFKPLTYSAYTALTVLTVVTLATMIGITIGVVLAVLTAPSGRPCTTDVDCYTHCGPDGSQCSPAGFIHTRGTK